MPRKSNEKSQSSGARIRYPGNYPEGVGAYGRFFRATSIKGSFSVDAVNLNSALKNLPPQLFLLVLKL